ncbi:MAG: hypothetical protein ABSH22_17635 [Tepidisphaeraceae bacterium]
MVRLNSSRRGSVLLMVVVLLLILSILATAYLSTARVDRVVSGQDIQNSQVDQLVDGVKDMAVANIVNGLFAYNPSLGQQYKAAITNTYATPTPGSNTTNYLNIDTPDYLGSGTGDPWLADRLPSVPNPAVISSYPGNMPYWATITAPLNAENFDGSGEFDSPAPPIVYQGTATQFITGLNAPYFYTQYNSQTVTAPFFYLTPTFITMPGTANVYPAFQVTVTGTNGASTATAPGYMIAGDASGDGIADCGLIRLPGTFADGLTYYAGVRIIDNNSGINVNTAWDSQLDYLLTTGTGTGLPVIPTLGASLYPTAVGLAEWLDSRDLTSAGTAPNGVYPPASAQVVPQLLTEYRLGLSGGLPSLFNSSTGLNYSTVVNDGNPAIVRSDVQFGSLAEALSSQLGRRVANPGSIYNNVAGPPSGPPYPHYRSFGDADAAALAYHFCLVNPPQGGLAETAVENVLPFSAFKNAPNSSALSLSFSNGTGVNLAGAAWKAYPAPLVSSSGVDPTAADAALVTDTWFNGSFDYSELNTYYTPFTAIGNTAYAAPPSALPAASTPGRLLPNLRPLLVTKNGLSNIAPPNTYGTAALPGQITSASPTPTLPPGILPYGDRGQ